MKFDATVTAPPANDHEVVRDAWSAAKRAAFDALDPAGLSLIATDGPVSVTLWDRGEIKRRIGHNRGVWPAKLSRASALKYSAVRNPFCFIGPKLRVWARTPAERNKLSVTVLDLIASRAEADGGLDTLLDGFFDLGPDLDLSIFELEISDIAQRVGVRIRDDDGLSGFLDRALVRADEIKNTGRCGRFDPVETAIGMLIGEW